jgi:hypothetical protein
MKKLTYCLILITIAANMNAGVFGRKSGNATCGIKVVSYKFVGNAGTELIYGNRSVVIPQHGVIELVAQKGLNSFQVAGKSFEIQNTTADEFGTATVELYRAASSI